MAYKKVDKCTPEILKALSAQNNIFWRFHNPKRPITSRSKSWEMGYSSAKEAADEGGTILEGKSCADKPEQLMEWADRFDNSYVVIAFYGYDTRTIGHDGETVAKYIKKVKTFNYNEFCSMFAETKTDYGWEWTLVA